MWTQHREASLKNKMNTNLTNIVVYHCRNLRLFQNGGQKVFSRSHPGLRLVAIPCSGKVEAHHLLKTLASGAAGVLVLACQQRACQFLEGSMRSSRRVNYARAWLEELGVEPERVQYLHVPPADLGALDGILEEFSEKLQVLGEITAAPPP